MKREVNKSVERGADLSQCSDQLQTPMNTFIKHSYHKRYQFFDHVRTALVSIPGSQYSSN